LGDRKRGCPYFDTPSIVEGGVISLELFYQEFENLRIDWGQFGNTKI
jgi:hypothetical protein